MSARIKIRNSLSLFSRNTIFEVILDGKEVSLMNRKLILHIESGVYSIQLKAKWQKTKLLIIKVKENETLFLRVRNGMIFSGWLLYAFYVILLLQAIFTTLFKLIKPSFFLITESVIFLLIGICYLYNIIFKRGEIWILEDDKNFILPL
jgi:hypothetical protein